MEQGTHFIGIGGIGMSALARILLDRKEMVSGSDQRRSSLVEALEAQGATLSAPQVGQRVVLSTAIRTDHPERVEAEGLGCPVIHRADLLAELMRGYKPLAVAGTHGKTTVSSLLAHVLVTAGWDPAFALGGILPSLQRNGRHGDGDYFVAEADESDGTFVKYHPFASIVTNVEADHLDHYGSLEGIHRAFLQFLSQSKQVVFCGDDPFLKEHAQGISYGFEEGSDWVIRDWAADGFSILCDLSFGFEKFAAVEVALQGAHGALNGAAVFALCHHLGMDQEFIRKGLASFPGVGRRCERKGEVRGVLVIDDYAHHPTEVRAVLSGIRRAIGPRKLHVIFQPHRYSRLQACLDEFSRSFDDADEVWVTDVYSAGEDPIDGVGPESLPFRYVARDALLDTLRPRPHDVIVTLGAGDITQLSDQVLQKAPPKLKVGLLFGGANCEHEISLVSGRFFANNLNSELYDVELFGIDRAGGWFHGDDAFERLEAGERSGKIDCIDALRKCELVVPVFHGPKGEDGLIPAFLEVLGIPFVGCDFRAASLCMHKAMTKRIAQAAGVPVLPSVDFSRDRWKTDREGCVSQVGFPAVVKPVHLGSSVGIAAVETVEELADALDAAFEQDDYVMVEKRVFGREFEFPVMGNDEVRVPPPGEVLSNGEIYDYDGKYAGKIKTDIAPDLDSDVLDEGRGFAEAVYRALGCKGLTRIDFFYDGTWWLNEANPMPGCTPISLFPKVWEGQGLSNSALLDHLVCLGLRRE